MTTPPENQHGANLIREIRETALAHSTELKPITLVGLPRWAALWLGRARAKELGKPLNQAHAESLREDANRQTPHAILWLPCDGHPNGGLFVFCHRGYEAGVLIGWRNYRPIGFPRTFSEYPDALCPWRSDQVRWIKNETVARKEYNGLLREISKLTRTQPAFVQPCEPLMAIIQNATQEAAKMEPPTLVSTWEELAAIPPSATHRLDIEPEHCNGWIKSIEEQRGTDSDSGIYLSTHTFYGSNYEAMTRKLQECGFNVQLANWDAAPAESNTQPDELP